MILMVSAVIVLMLLLSLHRLHRYSSMDVAAFSIPIASYHLFSDVVPGGAFYLVAAILSLLTMEMMWRIDSSLSGVLGAMCLASIFLNTIGWVFYEFYLPPDIYNLSFLVLYIAALIVIATGGDYAGGIRVRRVRDRLRGNSNAGLQLLGKDS